MVADANPPLAALHPMIPLEHAIIDLVGEPALTPIVSPRERRPAAPT